MADYNSSLPMRTENDGDAVIKIADGTTPSQHLAVNADGSINITDNSGSITVDASDLDIRDLSASQDNIAISDGTDTLAINGDGSINATVSASNLDIRDLVFATDKVDVSGSTVTIQDGGNSITVDATDLDIRDLDASQDNIAISDGTDTLGINADGSINVVVSGSAGTPVCDFNTSASVAKDVSVNHDYTVTALMTLSIEEVLASGSGKIKVQVLVDGNIIFVGFNSTANPNVRVPLESICTAGAGEVVRITITNRDNQAQDVYSTLIGTEAT
ncbi:MAG: hypothetical protein COB41_00320 [Proteobacteria bacterium]|nr:MAG: hypothetical protein COB41_00320 [Pseudomonadota bacterium]